MSYIIFGGLPISAAHVRAHAAHKSALLQERASVLPLSRFLFGFLAFASLCEADNIHKCAGPEGLVYRDTPCASGQQEQPFTSGAKNESQRSESDVGQRSQQTSRQVANSYAGTPLAATTLFIGMTDTQVLNLPSWGRPAQILRSKARPGWREEWVYKNRTDDWHLLYFENGRLAAREDVPAPTMEARASSDQ